MSTHNTAHDSPSPELRDPVQLSAWLDGAEAVGWEDPKTILNLPGLTSYRSVGRKTSGRVERCKRLDLARSGDRLALLVGLARAVAEEIDIWVGVYPTGESSRLPEDLQLSILDEGGETVMRAIAQRTESLQFEFGGRSEERFQVKLVLGEFSTLEGFVL